jgi:hypothetical protein
MPTKRYPLCRDFGPGTIHQHSASLLSAGWECAGANYELVAIPQIFRQSPVAKHRKFLLSVGLSTPLDKEVAVQPVADGRWRLTYVNAPLILFPTMRS